MRIRLSSVDVATRAYAEYRLFTRIARHDALVRSVDVVVRRETAANQQFVCTVVVNLRPSGRLKTQARAAHPSAAIDRAADRAGWLLDRRAARHVSA